MLVECDKIEILVDEWLLVDGKNVDDGSGLDRRG
jgi:hypothetical protein